MLPLNKVELTAYRLSGLAGSCFTLSQSIIWTALSMTGAICKYTACGSNYSKNSFAYCFYLTYLYEPQNTTDDFSRITFINPTGFNAIMWISALLSILNFVISAITAREFLIWRHARYIKIAAKVWPICIICFSCIELTIFAFFLHDIISVNRKEEDIKCFMKGNLVVLRSMDINERNPAPNLLQLKTNLQLMKKRIKKLKRKLLFLNAMVDMKSPNHLENPFISRKLATSYIEHIWRKMFNNNIQDTSTNKQPNVIPFDEMLKQFVTNENIHLDETDEDLIRNFDDLTNTKWIKPIESSNPVVYGKQSDLNPNMKLQTSTIVDNLTCLLLSSLKNKNEPPANQTELDQKLDEFFDDLFVTLKNETQKMRLKNHPFGKVETSTNLYYSSTTSTTTDNVMDEFENEEIILSLIELVHNVTRQNGIFNRLKETFENEDLTDIDDEQILEKMKQDIFEMEKQEMMVNKVTKAFNWRRLNKDNKIRTTTTTSKPNINARIYENNVIKELCENCSNFILGPSILCMVMSLKIFLIWILNLVIAGLTLYYDTLIEVKRQYFNFN